MKELARTQQLGALIIFTLTVIWVPILFAMGRAALASVVLLTLLVAIGSAVFVSRRGKPMLSGRIMMASLSVGLLYTIAGLGGIGHAGAGWVVMIPMSALFYLPVKDSPLWTVFAGLGIGVIWVGEVQGWVPASTLDPQSARLLDLFSLQMLVGTIAAGLSVRRQAWVRVNSALQSTNDTLQKEIAVRQRAEEEARDAVAARTGFLATISHEIRTPLNGVLGITEVLLDTSLDEEQRELAETVKSSGKMLRTLLDDVLDYSKIDAGRVDLESIALSLPNLANGVAENWKKLAADKGLELGVELGAGVPEWIYGDPVRLQQVLNNLVSNALKFTKAGHISVQLTREGERLHLRVQDTGVGMDAEAQKRIFQAFRQADSSVTRNYGGTGLGLAISRSLALAMDGELRVSSTPGQGSVFTLELPIREAEAPSVADQLPLETLDLSGVRILVAEDNVVNQVVVSRLLERLGVQVTLAADGQACLDAWEGSNVDLVLMDCQMPGMDGYQATERLRKIGVRTPIIALTANNMPGDRVRSLQAGMDDHLGKPIQPDALNACLQRWLRPSA
jgi:signal transduction histidine kinase